MSELTINGLDFEITIEPDYDMRWPWIEHDGHGILRQSCEKYKKPGEVIIFAERGNYWFYDFQETTKKAKLEKWGLTRQSTREAVIANMDYCRVWLDGQIHWVFITVKNGEFEDSLGGIEYDERDNGKYAHELAHELAENLAAQIERETIERNEWACRDGVTT